MDLSGIDVREKLDLLQLPLEAKRPLLLRFDPSSEPVLRLALLDEKRPGAEREHRAPQGPAPARRGPPEAGPRGGRGLRRRQGERRLRGRGAGVRRPAEARAARPVDRRRHAAHPRREREPVRRPPRAGHAALPRAHAERVRDRRADGERDHRDARTASRSTCATSRTSRAATRTAKRSRASTARRRSSSPSTRKATPTPCSSPTACARASRSIEKNLPEGTVIRTVYDQSTFIDAAISEVKSAAVIGGLLAILVLYAFLRDARATLIIEHRDSGLGARHVRADVRVRPHAQHHVARRHRARGRHARRQRGRGAREHRAQPGARSLDSSRPRGSARSRWPAPCSRPR